MSQFIYTGGSYREFRGYVFSNGKAVTVTDRATEAALKGASDFQLVKEKSNEEEGQRQGRRQEGLLKRPVLSVRRK